MPQESQVVVDVLDDIEQANGGQYSIAEIRALEGGLHDIRQTSCAGVSAAYGSRFDEHDSPPSCMQGRRDNTVAAANIENRTCGRKTFDKRRYAGVAMKKPKGRTFDFKAIMVPRSRVRHCLSPVYQPHPVDRWRYRG